MDAEKRWFFNIDFFRFRPRFWSLLGLQIRRAACSARRVKSHCIFAFGNTAFPCLGEAKGRDRQAKIPLCWGHVGTFFALGRSFFRSWTLLCILWPLLVHLGSFLRLLERSKLDFWCFSSPPAARRYVRSTSAASRRESRACQTVIISSSLCLPLRPASRIRLQIPGSKAFPHPFVPSPGPARTAALRPQFALEASKCDFFAFQKSSCFLLAFFLEKNAKIKDFDLPKPSPNPPKTPSKSMFQKTSIFSRFFATVFVYLLSWKP